MFFAVPCSVKWKTCSAVQWLKIFSAQWRCRAESAKKTCSAVWSKMILIRLAIWPQAPSCWNLKPSPRLSRNGERCSANKYTYDSELRQLFYSDRELFLCDRNHTKCHFNYTSVGDVLNLQCTVKLKVLNVWMKVIVPLFGIRRLNNKICTQKCLQAWVLSMFSRL